MGCCYFSMPLYNVMVISCLCCKLQVRFNGQVFGCLRYWRLALWNYLCVCRGEKGRIMKWSQSYRLHTHHLNLNGAILSIIFNSLMAKCQCNYMSSGNFGHFLYSSYLIRCIIINFHISRFITQCIQLVNSHFLITSHHTGCVYMTIIFFSAELYYKFLTHGQ